MWVEWQTDSVWCGEDFVMSVSVKSGSSKNLIRSGRDSPQHQSKLIPDTQIVDHSRTRRALSGAFSIVEDSEKGVALGRCADKLTSPSCRTLVYKQHLSPEAVYQKSEMKKIACWAKNPASCGFLLKVFSDEIIRFWMLRKRCVCVGGLLCISDHPRFWTKVGLTVAHIPSSFAFPLDLVNFAVACLSLNTSWHQRFSRPEHKCRHQMYHQCCKWHNFPL